MRRRLRFQQTRRLAGVLLGALVVLAASPAARADRRLDAAPVPLTGHVLAHLAAATRTGAPAPDQSLTLTIALRPAAPEALAAAVARAQRGGLSSTPPLTAAQFGATYGQPSAVLDDLAQYFARFGLQPRPPAPDHLSFQVTGTVAQVERALAVSLATYDDGSGHSFVATSRDPQLPANLASAVQAIFGLDTYPALHPLYRIVTGFAGTYTPQDMQTAYNLTPLLTTLKLDGTGQTIGVVGCDRFDPNDLLAFDQAYGLPSTSVTTIAVDGGADGDIPETTLDLEWSHAIAPGAAQRFYGFPSSNGGCPFSGFLDALIQATNDDVASVLSISLGACEFAYENSSPNLQAFETQLATAVAKGIGVVVASGDDGAFTCGGGQPTVAYPAASAFVTAVGGTSLYLTPTGLYQSEAAWGAATGDCASPCGSGGGMSQLIPEPSWQSAAHILDTKGYRGVPDVAWNADPATGNVLVWNGRTIIVGGTSIAAPQWAGLAALANQAAGQRLGQLAPLLYNPSVLGQQPSSCAPYHDVTTGTNLYYSAGVGWDFPTGWGSPNAYNLVRALVPSLPPATGVSSSAAARSQLSTSGQTTWSLYLPAVFQSVVRC